MIGNDAAVAWGGAMGNFELNVMLPVIARNLLESIRLLAAVCRVLADKCVAGIEADDERCYRYAASSPSIATALNPYIGYEAAARVVKRSLAEGRTIRDIVLDEGLVERGRGRPRARRDGHDQGRRGDVALTSASRREPCTSGGLCDRESGRGSAGGGSAFEGRRVAAARG